MANALAYAEEISWAKQLASLSKFFGDIALVTPLSDGKEVSKYYKKVYVVKIKAFEPISMGRVIEDVISKEGAKILIFPCTNKGRMLAGILSGKLGTIPITDVINISNSGNKFAITKLTFGGNAKVDIEVEPPFTLCISAGALREAEAVGEASEVEELKAPEPQIEVSFEPRRAEGVTPEKAEVVVGAGRGIKKKEDLEIIKELADLLGGAWSVTRPLAADYGWSDSWIGISGLIISPKLYVAVGISGQPHHMMGVRGSKIIVAINNDESAPIFEESDYGVVGDLYKILPALIKKLKEGRG